MKISNNKTFIVAELSANHQQKFDIAVETIKAIKAAGADAVKLQTYTPDTLTIDCDNDYFKIKNGTIWGGKNFYELYKEAYTPWEWQPKLKKIAEDLGLIFFSTPFDFSAVDFLENMNVPIYKVASFEITDLPLIKYIAAKKKPLIISTGIAELSEIENAINICKECENNDIILLYCVSEYPAKPENINLNIIPFLKEQFKVSVGISDHSLGIEIPIAAVALGACVIEKHFILDKKLGGPDAEFSLDYKKFKEMVEKVRLIEKTLGKKEYKLTEAQRKNRKFGRSLFAVKDIKKGEKFTKENIKSIRPSDGLPPLYYYQILNKYAAIDIKYGTPLTKEMIINFEELI
ncbi:MAG TPA: pseudaminic acid synthase [bacterium]|nr:pseudaminic acid synthase [bacterium]